MALVLLDRAQESATANTTVSFTMLGATTGYQTLAGVGDTNTTYYGATDGTNWEVGIGTYSTTGPTLTRTTILSSSNSNAAVSTFTSPVTVWVDYPAGRAVYENESGVITGYPITGGTIDNTVIGATTANTGKFSSIISNGLATIGAGQDNYIQINGTSTGGAPSFTAQGIDTDITLIYKTKGAGNHAFFTNNRGQVYITNTNLAVNYLQFTGAVSGNNPKIFVGGSSANIGLDLVTQGTGTVNITTANITGGTIDNTVIGGTTPAAGTFTTLTSTGGALNGTIGATTPAAGTFTTITGQTEVLKGTGNNFLTQTSTLSTWTNTNNTVTTGQADPFGGTSAVLLTKTAAAFANTRFGTSALSIGEAFTFSVYAQAGTNNNITLLLTGDNGTTNNGRVSYNLSTQVITNQSSTSLISSAITSVGGGWYRCSLVATVTANSSCTVYIYPDIFNATTAGTVTVYGPQLEIGSVLNTYIPTTTTAVYGTPTLSFSGVAGLGLQSDGSLYVSPAGTGALQAQKTDSTATGGNARGANAVDWQTSRGLATQVASGQGSYVGGGTSNTANATYSVVSGGNTGQATAYSSVVTGGYANKSTGNQATTSGGENNTSSGIDSFIGGGHLNNAPGWFSTIGGGEANSGTANATVTTQATTTVTAGSTAVTLSASNSNIKVGQLITGTGIVSGSSSTNYTYVAAISGTALTLSQNAATTGTPTLSFFTPHGVVVGGGNNQATGAYSFIGGGGDAGTAANRNVASGDWSVVCGGVRNTASGPGCFVGGGGWFSGNSVYPNNATAAASVVVGGIQNNSTANAAFIGAGYHNVADSIYSTVAGGSWSATRGIIGNYIFAASNNPMNTSAQGTQQGALLILARQTTDATATVLTSDVNAASTTNQVILPNNSAYYFRGSVISTAQFALATTAATGAAGTATLTFATQTVAPFVVGQTIVVAGVTPTGYNGTQTVTACTVTSVSYANATTGAQTVAGTVTATSLTKGWTIEGAIMRTSAVGGTRLIGSPTVTSSYGDTGTAAWAITATADTTNGGLKITFTGAAATTIRTVCKLETTEVTY